MLDNWAFGAVSERGKYPVVARPFFAIMPDTSLDPHGEIDASHVPIYGWRSDACGCVIFRIPIPSILD